MSDLALIEECKEYVELLFSKKNSKTLSYHNWKHTMNVFNAVNLIAENTEGITKENKRCLQLAAIFHDVGYLESPKEHEIRSSEIALNYLRDKVETETLEETKRLILATKLSHQPTDVLEEIIMDADLSHLGREDYIETTYRFLLKEMSAQGDKRLTEKDWAKSCVTFITAHKFLTNFARDKYRKVKLKNLEKVRELSKKLSEDIVAEELGNEKGKKIKKEKKAQDIKGVETMFRTSLRNHVNLSRIADNKANTLISVNAIIISIVLSSLFPKLDSNPFLFYPSVTILIGCFVTIILSILSTIPNVTRGLIGRDEVEAEKGNLLFFGNFHKMSLEDYEWSVKKLMVSKDYIYGSLTRDLFFLGKVLNKKYMLLRWAYYIFMVGMLASIILFVIHVMPYIGTTTDINFEAVDGIL